MAPIFKVGRDNAIPLITEEVEGDLPDFLWVLADGFGPMNAALDEEREARDDAALADLAERHATTPRRPAREIIAEAHEQRVEPTLPRTLRTSVPTIANSLAQYDLPGSDRYGRRAALT
ncbi:hypothetical protein ACFWMU_12750 [Streptomyces sp. NPDC058357]|uniref:hypothetical protein n=1 Tax=unclassified Streptomyces TaxID=2593676 RepID=UPI00365B6818